LGGGKDEKSSSTLSRAIRLLEGRREVTFPQIKKEGGSGRVPALRLIPKEAQVERHKGREARRTTLQWTGKQVQDKGRAHQLLGDRNRLQKLGPRKPERLEIDSRFRVSEKKKRSKLGGGKRNQSSPDRARALRLATSKKSSGPNSMGTSIKKRRRLCGGVKKNMSPREKGLRKG